MANAEPSYELHIHRRARDELDEVPKVQHTVLLDRIRTASRHRDPSDARGVERLEGPAGPGWFRARVGDYRAVLCLMNPRLLVVLVDRRARVYDRLEVAMRRAEDG